MRTKNENPLPKTGAVCVQWKKCGKPGCKCTRGELHGPYFAHFSRQGGRLIKRYVRVKEAESIAARCQQRREEQATERGRRREMAAMFRKVKQEVREVEDWLKGGKSA